MPLSLPLPAKFLRRFAPVILVGLLLSSSAFAQQTETGTLALQGVGTIAASPDMAVVTSGIVTHAKTARDALSENNAAMANLFDLLQAVNVEARDIQTSNFSVQPYYADRSSSFGGNDGSNIDHYIVSNNVTVRVRNLDGLGELLDTMVTLGANQIHNVSFAVEQTDLLYEQARLAAVADAIAKAELYASAAGVELGAILTMSEAGQFQPQMENFAVARMSMDTSVPVAAGELSFSSTISMTWALDQGQ